MADPAALSSNRLPLYSDPTRTMSLPKLRPCKRPMKASGAFYAGIEAKLIHNVAALRTATGNPDGPAALNLRDLPDN